MSYARLVPTLAAAGVCLTALGAAGVADAASTAGTPRPPARYRVVISPELAAPDGADTRGTVRCPTGTVPLGGGAIVSSSSTRASVGSSFPSGRTWNGDIKNASGAATTFQVEVICAKRPKGYTVIRGAANVRNPVGSQARAVATCPGRTMPLGGGGTSNAFSSFVNMNRTGPKGRSWIVKENNASGVGAELTAVAVCGKMKGYRVIQGRAFAVPANGQKGGSAVCTGHTVPIGGGALTTSKSLGVNVGGTIPSGDRWDSFMNDNSGVAVVATAIVVCARR